MVSGVEGGLWAYKLRWFDSFPNRPEVGTLYGRTKFIAGALELAAVGWRSNVRTLIFGRRLLHCRHLDPDGWEYSPRNSTLSFIAYNFHHKSFFKQSSRSSIINQFISPPVMADPSRLPLPVTVFDTVCHIYEQLSTVFEQQDSQGLSVAFRDKYRKSSGIVCI